MSNPALDVLREWPGLRGQTEARLTALSQLVDLVELETGRVLMHEGDVGLSVTRIDSKTPSTCTTRS